MKYFPLLSLLLLFSCGSGSPDSTDDPDSSETTSTTSLKSGDMVMPPLSSDSIQWLANNVGDVLVDLYNYNATMTLNRGAGAQQAVYFISPEAVVADISNCEPFGAIIYTGKKGVIYETEIYMDGQCSFIRFRENGNIVHHNKITKDAFDFFSNVLEKYVPPAKD